MRVRERVRHDITRDLLIPKARTKGLHWVEVEEQEEGDASQQKEGGAREKNAEKEKREEEKEKPAEGGEGLVGANYIYLI